MASPSIYGTAISTVCNLKCPHCLRESLGIRENEFMQLEKLAEHSEDLGAARRVSLFGLGEPFLHPRFFEFMAVFKGLGLEVSTSSHGMSLKPEVRAKILDSGLDDITISMDGADKKIFEETRVNAIYETVVENVSALIRERNARGLKKPEVTINMAVMRKNLHQVPDLVRLAHRMGADACTFSSVVVYKAADEHMNVSEDPSFERNMEKARSLAKKLGITMTFWRQKPLWWEPDFFIPNSSYGCGQLWSTEIIEPDGSMKLCCYIEEDVGNAFEMGLAEAFNCDGIRRERRRLMEGNVRPECQGCLYLRERSPSLIQGMINEAMKLIHLDPELTEEDRAELLRTADRVQREKDALYPLHVHVRIGPDDLAGRVTAFDIWEASRDTALPVS